MTNLFGAAVLGAVILAGSIAAQAAPRSYPFDAAKYFEDKANRGFQRMIVR